MRLRDIKHTYLFKDNFYFRGLIKVLLAVAVSEYFIMLFLDQLALTESAAAIADTFLIAIFAGLFTHFFILKPWQKHVENQNYALLSSMAEGLVVQNDKGEITYFNDAACKILGLTSDQIMGRTSLDPRWRSIKEDGQPFSGHEHPAMVALTTRKPQKNIIMGIHKPDSELRWILINSIPHVGTTDEAIAFTSFADITEEITMRRTLKEASNKMDIVANAVGFGVWEWDLKSDHLVWDPLMYQIFDIDSKSFTNDYEAFSKTLFSDDVNKVNQDLKSTFEKKKDIFQSLYRVVNSKAELKHIKAVARCYYAEDGTPLKMIGASWDITHEIESQKSIEQLFSWQSSLLESSKQIIISTDLSGKIKLFNFSAEKHLFYSSDEVVGKATPLLFIEKEDHKKNTEFEDIVVALQKTDSITYELNVLTKLQTTLPVRLTITLMKNTFDEPIGYLFAAEDLTDEHRLLLELEQERANAIHASKLASLGEMAGGVAHEINNPLSVIKGRATQLLRVIDAEPTEENNKAKIYVDVIIKTCDRIAKIVSGLKNFSRNADKDPLVKTSLENVIEYTVSLCQEKLKNYGVKLELKLEQNLFLMSRPTQLSQVLLNLINNSYDAICQYSEPWIKLEAKQVQEFIEIKVTDSGFGIPQAVVAKVMQPFFTTKEVGKGTGLGLSIAKGIVEDHGGQIFIDSKSNNTCFVIQLPSFQEISEKVA